MLTNARAYLECVLSLHDSVICIKNDHIIQDKENVNIYIHSYS